MIAAIIQARMGSNRFPGKTMKKILGKPMLWYIWNRLKAVKAIDDIIIVAPDLEEDNVIRDFAREKGIKSFSGPSYDVLNLFYQANFILQYKSIFDNLLPFWKNWWRHRCNRQTWYLW